MKRSLIKSIFTLFVVLSSHLYSQGAYLEKGKSGFGIAGAFSSNKDASAIGGSVAYSASGIVDLGVSVAQVSFAQKLAGKDLSATAVSPFMTIHAIKQDETTPVSISFSASYESDSYSSDALSQSRLTLSGSGYSFGASLYGNIPTSPTMKIQPSIGVDYVTSKSELKDTYGNSVKNDATTTIFGFGITLLFQTTPTTLFGISPSLSISKDYNTFGIRAGFVFII